MALLNSIPLFTIPKVLFTLYFGNAIATIAKNLYPLFRQCHCHKLIFFSSHFRQWHCHNCQKKIFPIIWFSLHALTLRAPTQAAGMGRKNCGNTIAENKKFLSPTFYLSLSNFCWILAMVLLQFTLFPQIAKSVETVPITPINFEFSNIQPKDSFMYLSIIYI